MLNGKRYFLESLESRLERLSPEERKEIEDFVDFLLSRSGREGISPSLPPAIRRS